MPPIIALIICTIFVLFLLRLDRKQYPAASLALWVPTIRFLLSTSKPLSFWLGTGGGIEEGSVSDQIVLMLLLFLGLIIIRKRKVSIIDTLKQNPSIILLLGFMLISISWSDIPFISFKRWFRNLIPIVMALIVASEEDPREALQCLFRRLIYVHLPISYMLIKYYPHLGRLYAGWYGTLMWTGVTSQKNGLVFLCSFSLFYFIWVFIRRWRGSEKTVIWYQKYIEIIIVILSINLFMGPDQTLTYSATSFAALLIGLITLVVLLWLKRKNIIISANILGLFIAAIIIYGTITPFLGRLTIFDPSAALQRNETLTERDEVWAALIPYAMNKPLLGHGFGGFWTDYMRETERYPAHNGYLDTMLNTGFIGLFILSLFMISNSRKARELMNLDFDWGVLWFCFVLMGVLRNITESVITSLTGMEAGILIFILISYSLTFSKQSKSINMYN